MGADDAPSVVWNGDTFAVFWQPFRAGPLNLATFDTSGQVVLTPREVLGDGPDLPVIAWTGTEYGVLWSAGSTEFRRLASDGTLLGEPVTIPVNACCPALAWTGFGYGAMYLPWLKDTSFYVHLDPLGQPTLAPTPVGSERQVPVSLVWNGAEFGLVLEKTNDGPSFDNELSFVRLSLEGQVLDEPTSISNAAEWVAPMVWTGLEYRVPWRGYQLNITRLDGFGDELSTTAPLSPGQGTMHSQSVFAGGSSVHAWSRPTGAIRTHGVLLVDENDSDVGPPLSLMTKRGAFTQLGLAFNGSEVAVAWGGAPAAGALYFQVLGCCLADDDNDGYPSCEDCDDSSDAVYPGAPQVCDHLNTDCADPAWPELPEIERDRDGDGLALCDGDCDDREPAVYPGAPQVDCDAVNNDCLDPLWPDLSADDADPDGDGYGASCDNCPDRSNPPLFDFELSFQGWSSQALNAADTWHRSDRTCHGEALPSTMLVSNGNAGIDCRESVSHEHSRLISPWLRIPEATEVWLELDALSYDEAGHCSANPTSADWKDLGINTDRDPGVYTVLNDCTPLGDGSGSLIHHSFDVSAWAAQEVRIVLDYDTFDERIGHTLAVDNVLLTVDGVAGQVDTDGDGFGDACDTCVTIRDVAQTDSDMDLEGDACDLDDGTIFLLAEETGLFWGAELGFESWNIYRGDLNALRQGGAYTQQPRAHPVVTRVCDQSNPAFDDTATFPAGASAFYLVTGNQAGAEGDLGVDSAGNPRPNTNPCSP